MGIPKVQVAIQGGGAKITALLAVAEVLQEAIDNKTVEVTRIAGTSAGALVGALLTAGISVNKIAAILREKGTDGVSQIVPISPSKGIWRYANWATRGRHTPILRLLEALWRGEPIVDSGPLSSFLVTVFADKNIATMEDLFEASKNHSPNGIQFCTVSADLRDQKIELSNEDFNKMGDAKLIPALLDSCALPVVLRMGPNKGNNQKVIVDGGICDNLPAEVLGSRPDHSDFGQIIGISFEPRKEGAQLDTSLSFIQALLDTSVNHTLNQARDRYHTHSIKCDHSTFDISGAIKNLENNNYKVIKNEAEKWFGSLFEKTIDTIYEAPWADWTPERYKTAIGNLYEETWGDQPLRYSSYTLKAFAYCCSSQVQFKDRLDRVERRIEIAADSPPFQSLRFAVASDCSKGVSPAVAFRAYDKNGTQIRHKFLPCTTKNSNRQMKRALLVMFPTPLGRGSDIEGPYTIRFVDGIKDGMLDLSILGYMEYRLFIDRPCDSEFDVNMVLYLPDDLGEIDWKKKDSIKKLPNNALNKLGCEEEEGLVRVGWKSIVKNSPTSVLIDVFRHNS